MELTKLEKTLLQAAAADLERLKRGQRVPGCELQRRAPWLQEAVADAQQNLVRLDVRRWLGHDVSAAGRMAVTRAWRRLEKAGLVERACVRYAEQRSSHVLITAAGRELATTLRAEAAT